jgi:hypothetical protein
MKQPEDIFNDWYASEGSRYWSPEGHRAFVKHAFLGGLDVYREELRLWEEGVKIYEGHEEAIENWKLVSDKATNALRNVDSRSKWEAQELYEWAKSRDIELAMEIKG